MNIINARMVFSKYGPSSCPGCGEGGRKKNGDLVPPNTPKNPKSLLPFVKVLSAIIEDRHTSSIFKIKVVNQLLKLAIDKMGVIMTNDDIVDKLKEAICPSDYLFRQEDNKFFYDELTKTFNSFDLVKCTYKLSDDSLIKEIDSYLHSSDKKDYDLYEFAKQLIRAAESDELENKYFLDQLPESASRFRQDTDANGLLRQPQGLSMSPQEQNQPQEEDQDNKCAFLISLALFIIVVTIGVRSITQGDLD